MAITLCKKADQAPDLKPPAACRFASDTLRKQVLDTLDEDRFGRKAKGDKIGVVVARGTILDDNDMVCDYKALKLLVCDLVDRLDHAMAVNSSDPFRAGLAGLDDRLVVFEDEDPTTEVVARWLFRQISVRMAESGWVKVRSEGRYRLPDGLELERVRVWEPSTSWAEYVGIEEPSLSG